eukprot:1154358-Pelagomonas_calceolata.AAC.14
MRKHPLLGVVYGGCTACGCWRGGLRCQQHGHGACWQEAALLPAPMALAKGWALPAGNQKIDEQGLQTICCTLPSYGDTGEEDICAAACRAPQACSSSLKGLSFEASGKHFPSDLGQN